MSPRPQDMGPADLAPNTVPPEFHDRREAIIGERNWFYNALPLEAKERFLEVLADARERGMDEEAAWREAVVAVETLYPPDPNEVIGEPDADAGVLDDGRDLPPPGP